MTTSQSVCDTQCSGYFREMWNIAVSQGLVILASAVFIASYRRITEYVKTSSVCNFFNDQEQ
jgi:hypothetical protein